MIDNTTVRTKPRHNNFLTSQETKKLLDVSSCKFAEIAFTKLLVSDGEILVFYNNDEKEYQSTVDMSGMNEYLPTHVDTKPVSTVSNDYEGRNIFIIYKENRTNTGLLEAVDCTIEDIKRLEILSDD